MAESSPATPPPEPAEAPTTASDAVPAPVEGSSPQDQLRERYLAALDRKHGRASGQGGSGSGGSGARPSAGSGPAKAQRTFRRKSGG